MQIKNTNPNLNFQAQVSASEFKNIKKLVVSSFNKATKGDMELVGSSCLDLFYNLRQARVSSDIDIKLSKLNSKKYIQNLIEQSVFPMLKENNYIPFDLKLKTIPAVQRIKNFIKRVKYNQYFVSFKLNPTDPVEYKNFKTINLDLSENFYGVKGKANINGEEIKTLSPEEFVLDKVKALCQKTKSNFLKNSKIARIKFMLNKSYDESPKFKEYYSRGKFIYDLSVASEGFNFLKQDKVDTSLLKGMFKKANLPLSRIEEIPGTYLQHKDSFSSQVIFPAEVQGKNYDDCFNDVMQIVQKIKSEIN